MNPEEIAQAKRELRRELRAYPSLPAEAKTAADAAIAARVAALPEWASAARIFAYLPSFPNEVDTWPLIAGAQAAGKSVWAPQARPAGRLTWGPVLYSTDLIQHVNLQEPRITDINTSPTDTDVLLVPGLAFTPQGMRLGRGGGYYDRLLADSHATAVGLVFDAYLRPTLPCAAHDRAVDLVVTETALYRH